MNFTSYLNQKKQINESCSDWSNRPVIIGYGSFFPFHIGYLPMISAMLRLSEETGAQPIVSIVSERPNDVAYFLEVMERDFPKIEVQVSRTLAASLLKLNKAECVPHTIFGDARTVQEAKDVCETLYTDKKVAYKAYSSATICGFVRRSTMNNNFEEFRATLVESSPERIKQAFQDAKEALNG